MNAADSTSGAEGGVNSRERAALDEHIAGGDYHKTSIELRCPNGHKWMADAVSEYGSTDLVNEADMVCPTCGELEEEVE